MQVWVVVSIFFVVSISSCRCYPPFVDSQLFIIRHVHVDVASLMLPWLQPPIATVGCQGACLQQYLYLGNDDGTMNLAGGTVFLVCDFEASVFNLDQADCRNWKKLNFTVRQSVSYALAERGHVVCRAGVLIGPSRIACEDSVIQTNIHITAGY